MLQHLLQFAAHEYCYSVYLTDYKTENQSAVFFWHIFPCIENQDHTFHLHQDYLLQICRLQLIDYHYVIIVTTILIISFNTSIIISFVDSKTFIIIIFRVMDTKDKTKNANQPILSNSVMFSVLLQDWNSKKVCKACCHREIVSN